MVRKLLFATVAAIGLLSVTTFAEERTDSVAESASESIAESTSDTLVIYFSATGTTKGVAEKIAELTDADLYEIVPKVPYTDEDLNYNDRNSRTSNETADPSVRPEIGGELPKLDDYTTIYLGYPIWWGEAPRIMSTFVESEEIDFEEKTVIPFVTSDSSGIGGSAKTLEEQAESGEWKDGKRFSGNESDEDLLSWIEEVNK